LSNIAIGVNQVALNLNAVKYYGAYGVGFTILGYAVPAILFALYGGLVSDGTNRRKLFLNLLTLYIIGAISLAIICSRVVPPLWLLVLANVYGGAIAAFYLPNQHSLISDLVNQSEVNKTHQIFNCAINLGLAIGPLVCYQALKIHSTHLDNQSGALAFLFFGIGMVPMMVSIPRIPPDVEIERQNTITSLSKRHPWLSIREGVSYIKSNLDIKMLMLTLLVTSFFGTSFSQLLSIYAQDHAYLNHDPHFFSSTFAAFGFGQLLGTIIGAQLVNHHLKFGNMSLYLIIFFCGSIALALQLNSFWGVLFAIFLVGLFGTLIYNLLTGMVQSICDQSMRGRVSSVLLLIFGLQILSAAIAGFFIHLISSFTPSTFMAFTLVQSSGVVFMLAFALCMVPYFKNFNKLEF